ncbi:menaquinol-cytochrome c reductase cytochrome b subunit [Streptomyces spiroverticillatus]|uniref:Cytochrome bc1 complex cytochrome b subunit n=1 Tax=Streptomyces finlayi TaxID=67296 RepID=A0A918WWU0_9ACTN|nr:ubiquinol-cytochrome c reductase cytochrome b subunit [Streptomyces finlayi]GHA09140.1 menaquinol-cytochrome c reductase cytochrome b subunit [Streptomyces spiroverticillatus]GHC91904.1 menaquinol-cytochrome c reductase cytochrome b subunit [Streptomyces finlayi]
MGNDGRPLEPERGSGGDRLVTWVDSRTGLRGLTRSARRTAFPDHWSFLLGEIALYSLVILLITGVYLSLYFHPSSDLVAYDGRYAPLRGRLVSQAFDSTLHLSFDVRGGLLVRQAHHWAALVFVAAVFAHLMRVFFTGAFRKPRELNWVLGFLLLVLAMFAGLTGYDLPGDLLSGTGLQVVNGTLLSIPIVGTYVSFFLFGGEFPGEDLIARFNTLHTLVLPGVVIAVLVGHVVLAVRHRHTQYAGPGRTENNVVGLPFKVYAVKSAGYFCFVFGVIFFMAAVAQINPVWDYGPFRPDQVSAGSQPDWYMGVADGLLRVMPGWEIDLWGHTLALDNLLPLLAGMLLFLAMGAYPFLEAWVTDDDQDHHLLDRPRNRPVRTALGVAWLSVYAVALIGAANDVMATTLHVSVNSATWTVRIGLFVAPVLAFVITKRLALALQRRDRDKVLHGRETGIIKLLPHGEYVEVHEPIDQARLHTLTAHEQYLPLEGGPDLEPDGPAPTRRLRVALSRVFHGPGTQIPKPSPTEHKELIGRHRP